jgi:hypothetical protein
VLPATPSGGITMSMTPADLKALGDAIAAGIVGGDAAKEAAAKAKAEADLKALKKFRKDTRATLEDAGMTGPALDAGVEAAVGKKFPHLATTSAPTAPGMPPVPGTPPVTNTTAVYHTTTNGTFQWWYDGEHVVVKQVSTGTSHPFLRTEWDAALKREGNIETLASKALASGVLPTGKFSGLTGRLSTLGRPKA